MPDHVRSVAYALALVGLGALAATYLQQQQAHAEPGGGSECAAFTVPYNGFHKKKGWNHGNSADSFTLPSGWTPIGGGSGGAPVVVACR